MEVYSYTAVGTDGKDKKGTVEAESERDAAKKIKADGLIPMSVQKQSALNKDINLPFLNKKKKIKPRDLSVFCRQFSSILKAGVSVINALEMLADQTENKTLREAVVEVQSNVEKGETLSKSMKAYPDAFPSLLISMIEAGESSGNLESAFERMAVQFEKDAKLQSMIKKAMTYPVILIIVAIGVVIAMMVYVIPSFVSMFDDMGSDLPVYTQMLVNLSDFIIHYWYIAVLIIIAIVAAYKAYYKTDSGRHNIDRLKLKVPVFGKLKQKTACARFTRTLSTLVKSGMPMMDAIDIAAGTIDNVLYKDALLKAKNGVGLGFELSGQLQVSGLFPPLVIHMTNIGEETGNLEEMLTNIANYYDEEIEATTQQISALMEPMIILVMAVVVGGLIMAIYSPLIQLYDQLG